MKHSISQAYNSPSGVLASALVKTGESSIEQDIPFASDASNYLFELQIKVASLLSMCLLSDQDCTITFENYSNAGMGTIALSANLPFIWSTGLNPEVAIGDIFTGNISHGKITNSSDPATAGTLRVRVLVDPTDD